MTCITRQSILKACYQLDQHNIPLRKIDGKPVGNPKSVGARVDLCAWWLGEFKDLDTVTWDKVITLMLKECKEYPDIEKLYELINRAGALNTASANEQTAITTPAPPIRKNKGISENFAQMLALAKQGLWSEARKVIARSENEEQQLQSYAKQHYPAKCSASWIEKNRAELMALVRDEERCNSCISIHRCRTKGCHAIGLIDKYGNIAIKYMECSKVVKTNEEVY